MRVPAKRAAALRALAAFAFALAAALAASTLTACKRGDAAKSATADAKEPRAAATASCVEGGLACAHDGRSIERCADGGRVTVTTCRGPAGCRARDAGEAPSCDDSIAAPGDVCDREGQIACSEDRRIELRCADAGFRFARECGKPCEIRGDDLFCD